MTPRDRVHAALAHVQPDFAPCDYFATPEIHSALLDRFQARGDAELRTLLGTDIRYVQPPYIGPPLRRSADGAVADIWGITKRPMPNEYGDYAEPVGHPYAGWTTVEEAEAWPWPSPDWYDYEAVPALCAAVCGGAVRGDARSDLAVATGDFSIQDFINGTAFGRGVEQVLLDIAVEDPVFLAIVEKRHRFAMELIGRTLEAARGRIDLVLCGDDFGSQRGLLISPQAFDRLFAAKKKELFDLVHSFGAKVSHHCCGSSVELIPRFIELGMDALQTIQPQAAGMNPYRLKEMYGRRITLHGAVDVQGWLQKADPAEIEREVTRLMEVVGEGGGFILAPCHNLQPDTPLANVLAVYRAVARFRGDRERLSRLS
jgi:uroporphyrinogen decarboxylase